MQTIRVKNDAELRDAITASSNGGTIELVAGTYDGRSFDQVEQTYSQSAPLIFKGIGARTIVEGTIDVIDSANITFDNLTFQTQEVQYTGSDPLPQHWHIGRNVAVQLDGSDDIAITNSTFLGYDITQDYYVRGSFNNERYGLGVTVNPEKTDANGIEKGVGGIGITIRSSDNLELTGNRFDGLYDAINFYHVRLTRGDVAENTAEDRSDGTLISHNHFTGLQQDGIRGTDHSNTTVQRNLFENFEPISHFSNEPRAEPKTHSDAIQYWEDNAAYGVTGLTVTENVFFQPDGALQVVFGHQRGQRAETDTPEFHSFTITDNVVLSGSVHGVSLGSILGAPGQESEVSGNTLLWNGIGSAPQIRLSGWETPSSPSATDLATAGYTNYVDISDNLMQGAVVLRGYENNQQVALAPLNATVENNGGTSAELSQARQSLDDLYSALTRGLLDLVDLNLTPTKPSSTTAALPTPAPQPVTTPDPDPAPAPTPTPTPTPKGAIEGTTGNDKLFGTAGDDTILGMSGSDRILAGAGDDTIEAGAGNDWFVLGGSGRDTFVFGRGDGGLKVADWEDGTDKISLVNGLTFDDAILYDVSHAGRTTAVMGFDSNDDGRTDERLLISNFSVQDLGASDFL